MRKLIIFFCIMLTTLGLIVDAHAKRFGGGKSFGLSHSRSSYSSHSYSNNRNNMHTPGERKRLGLGSFLRPIGGFILGGLIASLLMGHGFGTGILSWFALIAVIFLIMQFFRGRSLQYQQLKPNTSPVQFEGFETSGTNSDSYKPYSTTSNTNSNNIFTSNVSNLAKIDVTQFLKEAEILFRRLQRAYNDKNLLELREFTTPEVYTEVQTQINEMNSTDSYIEILKLETAFISSETVMRETIASVRFSGLIREALNEPARSFVELWHFKSEMDAAKWKVAGIEQEEIL